MTRLVERIAKNLRGAREAAGLSRERLARKAEVSARTIYRLERGETVNPRPDEFERIAQALNMTSDELRGIDDEGDEPSGDTATYADLVRQAQKATGNRKVAIGFARAITDWNELGEAERKLLEAALEMLPHAPEGPEDISKTEF